MTTSTTRRRSPVRRAAHQSVKERAERGKAARAAASRDAWSGWQAAGRRPDPIALLERQNEQRLPFLVPLRHARMSVSPFTFYRGAAGIMAMDLAKAPRSGLTAQLGGDAHLSNFGAYASASRELVFDANDFDETLPGPFEWDVARLATSLFIAGQNLGFPSSVCRSVAAQSVRSFREAIARYAKMDFLDVWYDHLTAEQVAASRGLAPSDVESRVSRFSKKARAKTSLQALDKLAIEVDGRYQIRYDPPVLYPLRELPTEFAPDVLEAAMLNGLEAYKQTLPDDRHALLDRFVVVDMGLKVVGVGSVGTRCLIMLLEGRDRADPLFLQVKEAGPSVLEEHLGKSSYENAGRRVVEGQRLIQAQSDIFLGWVEGELEHRQYYVRQLRDWKGSVDVETGTPEQLNFYAHLCGMTLGRGHARSGDPSELAGYLGKRDDFDRGMASFAEAYAKQNLADYDAFTAAIKSGRLEASPTDDLTAS